ncbi:hypothetical protein OHV05_04330 [Kitasatospora sp. NBC_00070]|uniref:phage head completion protein n=1 Tax=Kitasatospora sp. NBC_00070 TaxID=2975962 RepID=UPI0032494135
MLDRGRDRVLVYPLRDVDDGYGGTQPGVAAPVTVWATVRPATTAESPEGGYLTSADHWLTARTLPAGPWSRVEWDGTVWTVVGDPKRFRGSRRTAYATALIRPRGGDAPGDRQAEH